jgi:hypothetical protein
VLSALAAAALLAACSGGGVADPTADAAVATTLGGTVATGAPLADARLRIVDAAGNVVAQNVPVDADGRYAPVTLTGSAPWRIEACGYSGPNYQCIYSVAQAAGTANVTPLTSAMLLLASGQQPEALMTGTASALTANALATAQTALLGALAPVLSDAGVSASLDLVSGTLQAGSRTGYDRVLDSVGVATGVDAQPFVQISPRLGSGNLYMEQGSATVGQLASTSGAAQLSLQGLEQLFRNMTLAARTSATCMAPADGMATLMASSATMSMGGEGAITGPAAVGAGLCELLAGGGGEPVRLGSRFLSPTLGRCDLSGSAPVCGISFVLQDVEGNVEQLGGGMGVVFESGAWKFKGDLLPIGIEASARVQRNRRIDGTQVVTSYSRALAFEIQAVSGLACAKVAQRNADGAAVTLALFKPHVGEGPVDRLSAWRDEQNGASRSLNPAVGNTRNGDDTWLELPEGTEGDTAVRNFFRGGRSVTVSLFSDNNCSAPFTVAGRSSFEVDVQGVPPVWAQMPNLPWPSLTDTAAAALRAFTVPAGGSANYAAAWSVASGSLGVGELIFCSDRAECGQGGSGRVGEARLRGAATSAAVTVQMPAGVALESNGYKMLAIYGRTADGVGMQSSHASCSARPAGAECEGN